MQQILSEKMLKRDVKCSNQQFMAEFFGEHLAKGEGVAWTTAFDGDPLKETGAWSGRPVTGQALSCGVGDVFGPAAAGLNTYVSVSVFEKNAAGRRKEHFVAQVIVGIDDVGPGDSAKIPLKKIKLAPTAVVETSPGNYQVLYKTYIRDRETADKLVRALVFQGLLADKDPGMIGVTRNLRLPNGINGKPDYDDHGKPFQVKLRYWQPGKTYSVDELVKAYDLDLDAVEVFDSDSRPSKIKNWREDPFLELFKIRSDGGLDPLPHKLNASGSAWVHVHCPWVLEHTGREPSGAGYCAGSHGFKCHHGHCEGRGISQVREVWRDDFGIDLADYDRRFNDLRDLYLSQALADRNKDMPRAGHDGISDPADTPRRQKVGSAGARTKTYKARAKNAGGKKKAAGAGSNGSWEKKLKRRFDPPAPMTKATGLLGQMAEFFSLLGTLSAPIMEVGFGLPILSHLTDNNCAVVYDGVVTALPVFVVGVAPTGSGKEKAQSGVDCCCGKAVTGSCLFGGDVIGGPASAPALRKQLGDHSTTLWVMDEFGTYLSNVNAKGAGSDASKALSDAMEAYSRADGVLKKKPYADGKNMLPAVERPFLNMLLTTTGSTLQEALRVGMASSGFLNRLILIEQTEQSQRRPARPDAHDLFYKRADELEHTLAAFVNRLLPSREKPTGRVKMGAGSVWPVRPSEAACRLLEQITVDLDEATGRGNTTMFLSPDIWGRARENLIRVAGLAALSDAEDPRRAIMTKRHVQWARNIIWASQASLQRLVDGTQAASTAELQDKMLTFVTDQPGRTATKSEITRKFKHNEKVRRDNALVTLVDGGELLRGTAQTNGRDCITYMVAPQ